MCLLQLFLFGYLVQRERERGRYFIRLSSPLDRLKIFPFPPISDRLKRPQTFFIPTKTVRFSRTFSLLVKNSRSVWLNGLPCAPSKKGHHMPSPRMIRGHRISQSITLSDQEFLSGYRSIPSILTTANHYRAPKSIVVFRCQGVIA